MKRHENDYGYDDGEHEIADGPAEDPPRSRPIDHTAPLSEYDRLDREDRESDEDDDR